MIGPCDGHSFDEPGTLCVVSSELHPGVLAQKADGTAISQYQKTKLCP
jgi:hypothetical protein